MTNLNFCSTRTRYGIHGACSGTNQNDLLICISQSQNGQIQENIRANNNNSSPETILHTFSAFALLLDNVSSLRLTKNFVELSIVTSTRQAKCHLSLSNAVKITK